MRIANRVAQLTGAAALAAHRRHGVPVRTAVATTQPGSKSQQQVQRQGFDLLFIRAVL